MQDISGAEKGAKRHPAENFSRSKHVELRYHLVSEMKMKKFQ